MFGALAFAGAGMFLAGCKTAPELTADQATALIQAKYDADPAAGVSIMVDDFGLKAGLAEKYWKLAKVYSNNRWADYTLLPDGKKVMTLNAGGDVIEWRPETGNDSHFLVTTVATNHLKARDVQNPQNDVGGTKSAVFTETVNLDGVPAPLQDMAHHPGNKLGTKKTATFAVDGGAWKLQSIN